ncbi:MAG: amidohydrolase [Bacteroidales bacterium]|nr:amidohydrolase [Bacteroidales bacterium]MDD3960433.1 amidohydrolase [Bacteroidales bacterium]MDY0285951.1 amidohydrolase [Bacteroidales bacterium]HPE86114.1 amidohydrolase [Bacteroidales bacterium]
MKLVLSVLILMLMMMQCTVKEADVLLKNGLIYTVDSAFTTVTGMVYRNGIILETGKWEELLEKYHPRIEFDLNGKCVYPGFIDAHSHFYGYGTFLAMADLTGASSFDEVILRLKRHAKIYPGQWIVGRGWDQNHWPDKKFPVNTELDRLFPDKFVVLIRVDGHAVLVNSPVMHLAGFNATTAISGGEILTENGKVTGVVLDKGADRIRELIPELTAIEKRSAILKAQENCFKVGLTSVCEAGADGSLISLFDEMHRKGELKMRIYAMLNPGEANEEQYMQHGPYITDFLTVRSLKLYADGALGSRGAALLEPYSDDPENSGIIVTNADAMRAVCARALTAGFQVNTHAIGDAANRQVLNVYREFLSEKNDLRWRIEHAQTIHPDDLPLFGKYAIIPSIQTTHCTSDMEWAGSRLGQRIENAYIYKELLQQNGWIPNGTDFPIEDIDPLKTFYSAVFRRNLAGWPAAGFQMENALTREEALRSVTIWAAKAGFDESRKGSLEPGKVADFVILNQDILSVDESAVLKTKVLATFVNGDLMIKNSSFHWK